MAGGGCGGLVSPEELTPSELENRCREEEAAFGLTPGGGDRTAGTRALEEGGTELGSESLAEAGMQASQSGESPWRRKGKIRTGRGRVDGEREATWVCWQRGNHGQVLPLLALPGPQAGCAKEEV